MRDAENVARLRLAETALAVERYRLKNENRLPENLENLTPAHLKGVPQDPFDGKPPRYERLGGSYVPSSIGEDGGAFGSQESPGRSRIAYDLRFSVERREDFRGAVRPQRRRILGGV